MTHYIPAFSCLQGRHPPVIADSQAGRILKSESAS
jgi:hypothetical protein